MTFFGAFFLLAPFRIGAYLFYDFEEKFYYLHLTLVILLLPVGQFSLATRSPPLPRSHFWAHRNLFLVFPALSSGKAEVEDDDGIKAQIVEMAQNVTFSYVSARPPFIWPRFYANLIFNPGEIWWLLLKRAKRDKSTFLSWN